MPVMIVSQQKGRDTKEKLLRNFGDAEAGRLSQGDAPDAACRQVQSAHYHVIDTLGAYPGIDAEERGQAEAIAVNFREMSRLTCPVIAVVLGEGGSGGALGLGVANRVYMLENAYYSVISPESCAAIIWRDSGEAPAAAAALKLTAQDLMGLRLIDGIVPEPPEGAQVNPDAAASALREVLMQALRELTYKTAAEIVAERYSKFRNMGTDLLEDLKHMSEAASV